MNNRTDEDEVGLSDGKNITMPLLFKDGVLLYGPRDIENSIEHVGSPKPSDDDLDQQKWVNDKFLKIMHLEDIERKIKFYIYKDTDGKFHEY